MTQHTTEISTILIYLQSAQLSPALITSLRSTYDRIILRLNGEEPTEHDLKDAHVIFGLTIPKDLKRVDQVPKLKLYQAVSAGYSHITGTEFFEALKEKDELMFANASGIHV